MDVDLARGTIDGETALHEAVVLGKVGGVQVTTDNLCKIYESVSVVSRLWLQESLLTALVRYCHPTVRRK